MKDKTMTDVLLICKGWYNKHIYRDTLDALNAYYHKYYGCEDIVMDKSFAESLFLRPLTLAAIEKNPKIARQLLYSPCDVIDNKQSFSEIMYDKMLMMIHMIENNTFDLSEYEEMFNKAKECNYTDDTIGII